MRYMQSVSLRVLGISIHAAQGSWDEHLLVKILAGCAYEMAFLGSGGGGVECQQRESSAWVA